MPMGQGKDDIVEQDRKAGRCMLPVEQGHEARWWYLSYRRALGDDTLEVRIRGRVIGGTRKTGAWRRTLGTVCPTERWTVTALGQRSG